MDKEISAKEALDLLGKGIEIEYQDNDEEDFWWTLYEDQPIRLLWERKLRIK